MAEMQVYNVREDDLNDPMTVALNKSIEAAAEYGKAAVDTGVDPDPANAMLNYGVAILGNIIMKVAEDDHGVFVAQEAASHLIEFVRQCVKQEKELKRHG